MLMKLLSSFHIILQDWQLKLSGIDVTLDNEETEETDTDSPIGAINPMLIQDGMQSVILFFYKVTGRSGKGKIW